MRQPITHDIPLPEEAQKIVNQIEALRPGRYKILYQTLDFYNKTWTGWVSYDGKRRHSLDTNPYLLAKKMLTSARLSTSYTPRHPKKDAPITSTRHITLLDSEWKDIDAKLSKRGITLENYLLDLKNTTN